MGFRGLTSGALSVNHLKKAWRFFSKSFFVKSPDYVDSSFITPLKFSIIAIQ